MTAHFLLDICANCDVIAIINIGLKSKGKPPFEFVWRLFSYIVLTLNVFFGITFGNVRYFI